MERLTQFRARILIVVFSLVVAFFAFRLYDLQIIETGGKTDNTSTFVTRTRVKADRGDIMDTNGNLLVGNRASYDLVINHYVLLSASGTTDHLYRLLQRCQEEGIEYNEHFPISTQRPFTYTLSEYNSAWQNYFQSYLAYMGGLDSDITAPLLIQKLRDRYSLPAEWTDEEARLVIGLYYELALRQCVGTLSNYVFLSDVNEEDLSTLMELNIPGMNVEASTIREYHTRYAAHILGYVGPMDADQWEYYKTIDGYQMDAEVGQAGLERLYEEMLHGVDGLREDTVATDGTLISSRYLEEPQAGANVEVTLDINLQMVAEDAMASTMTYLRSEENEGDGRDAGGAAVVAMEVKTGKVLVCASYPTYDLANFFTTYNEILETPFDPLYNRALSATYPPGSTYKMSMVIAGIDSHIINSETKIEDLGIFDKYREESDFYATCLLWSDSRTNHGFLNASEALRDSCNYFFYELADKISLSAMDSTAKGLGLGEPTGVELAEDIGHRANEETKKKIHTGDDAEWYQASKILAAIGQDDNKFSPMQLCVYTCTIANQGKRYKASFLNRVVSSDYRSLLDRGEETLLSTLDISDEAYHAVLEGMKMVCTDGTAKKVFADYPISVAAKTGTAQTGIPNTSDNGAFVCFAPADNPQIAIAVYGEKAGHGSSIASIAKEMLDSYFEVGEVGDVLTYENMLS